MAPCVSVLISRTSVRGLLLEGEVMRGEGVGVGLVQGRACPLLGAPWPQSDKPSLACAMRTGVSCLAKQLRQPADAGSQPSQIALDASHQEMPVPLLMAYFPAASQPLWTAAPFTA